MPLEKTQENLTTCQICKRLFNNHQGTQVHVARTHELTSQQYYDMFYKPPTEGNCIDCGKNTKYDNKRYKYSIFCSNRCSASNIIVSNKVKQTNIKKYGGIAPACSELIRNKMKQTTIDKYGVDHVSKTKEFKNKVKQTSLLKYGTTSPMQNEEIKEKIQQTNLKRYGTICTLNTKINIEKKINTWNKNFGVDNPSKSDEIKKKKIQTSIDHYGVEYPIQNKDVLEKCHKSRHQSKQYTLPSNKIIWKMGYEPQFLDYVFKNNILTEDEIDYSPKGIKYVGKDDQIHYYFPDFYIPKWNLIIEIKSDWTESLDENVNLKETTTKEMGFNYIRLVNHNFTNLIDFLKRI